MAILLGIDVGGTFTDFIAYDTEDRSIRAWKCFSSSEDPGDGILLGLRTYDRLDDVRITRLGTTIATNAILERTGARVAYLATKGFEDVPFIQRGNRKDNFNAQWRKPLPLVLRNDCRGVPERVSAEGDVLQALDEARLRDIAAEIREAGDIEAIAVNFLFSYRVPGHEQAAKAILAEELPGVPVSISFDVLPKWKEYERASTTIADAYVKPIVLDRLPKMEHRIKSLASKTEVVVVKSNGGGTNVEGACESPVQLLLSGPAGGVIATQFISRLMGEPDVITFDMGGTSTDCALCFGGEVAMTTDFEVEWGLPAQVPMIDVRTIGAGGGSIVWIDQGGLLRVGPSSAGSVPGPVCYGRGGTEPTVTDANVVLGRIDPNNFLGGALKLDMEGARAAIARIGNRLSMGTEQTARAIIKIANNNIIGALRTMSVEKGHDPRKFAVMGFGGAGPVHTADLIDMMGSPRGIVPIFPGQFSALGFTACDARVDRQRTVQVASTRPDVDYLNSVTRDLTEDARAQLAALGMDEDVSVLCVFDMRYLGQNYELDVPVAIRQFVADDLKQLWLDFDTAFKARYGFSQSGEPIEIINVNITAIHRADKPRLKELPRAAGPAVPKSHRDVWFGEGWITVPIFDRAELLSTHRIKGPAVIEEDVSVTIVNPGQEAVVDPFSNIVIHRSEAP
jgi:N-methylhydantoinase A